MADVNDVDRLYSVTTTKTVSLTSGEVTFLLFKNPVGSGRVAVLKKIIASNLHTIADSWVRTRYYIAPTITVDGTGLTENPLDFGGAGGAAVCTTFLTPTVSANGTLFLDLIAPASMSLPVDLPDGCQLQPGQNMLVTAIPDGPSRIAGINLLWEEE